MIVNLQRDMKWVSDTAKLDVGGSHGINEPTVANDGTLYRNLGYCQVAPQVLSQGQFVSFGVGMRWQKESPIPFRVKGFSAKPALWGVGWTPDLSPPAKFQYFGFGENVDECVCLREIVGHSNEHLVFFMTVPGDSGAFIGDLSVQSLLGKPESYNSAVYG